MQSWLANHLMAVLFAGVAVVVIAAFALTSRPAPAAIEVRPIQRVPTPTSMVYVHVAGAVAAPGVFSLADGSRVFEAIEAAGGANEDADLRELNLAAKVADGQKLVIPAFVPPTPVPTAIAVTPEPEEAPPVVASAPAPTPTRRPATQAAAAPGGKVNLNTGSQRALESLPGIGPVTAKKIIDYRQANGRITSAEQLRDAKVINNSMYEKIKDLVTV